MGQARNHADVSPGSTSVLLFGWEALTVEAISTALEAVPSLEVVAKAAEVEDIARYARGHRPDVVLLVSWPGDPVALTERTIEMLADASPESRVLVLGRSTDARVVRGTLRAGANGYVLGLQGIESLVEGIELAAQNYAYVSHRLGCEIARIPDAGPEDLTAREQEILSRIAHGQTNSETALDLSLSVRTIESHRRRIYDKLGFSARHELVSYAIESGLLTAGAPAER